MVTTQELIALLQEAESDIEIYENEPMSRHTTFAIGGPADVFIQPKTVGALQNTLRCLRQTETPYLMVGNGSNMLVSDAGVRGAVVCTAEMDHIAVGTRGRITAGAGALLSAIARRAQREGLTGAEFAGGIPGSLGGAVFMNAGAYDGQMALIVRRTEYLDGEGNLCMAEGPENAFGYRKSIFRDHPEWTIVRAELELAEGDPAAILLKMNDLAQRRREKQPLNYPSAGSTFKRPEGHFAGQLIEQCGLKGLSVGAAQVSEKHAGFLINRGGATCADMLKLIETVQNRVREAFGVQLECEVRIIG